MPRPVVLRFGPWLPDGADVAFGIPAQSIATAPLADVLNVYFAQGVYRSLPSPVRQGAALPARALGAAGLVLDSGGAAHGYAGAGSDLYLWNGAAWASVSKSAGAYAGAQHWSFAQFADCVLAADGIHALQDAPVSGGAFADIADAPIGNALGTVGQFVFVGDITSPDAVPYRVRWCAIGDPTKWPVPLTDTAIATQSSQEDLTEEFGAVKHISGGPQAGIVLQRHGITRLTYQGGDKVFAFYPYERKRGCVGRGAAVHVGAVTHFIADDGFFATDGSQVIPTGEGERAGLNKWFWKNVNTAALDAISGAWDADRECVAFAIPTGANTLPDTLLLLNPRSGQWTRAALSTELAWTVLNGGRHALALIDQSHFFCLLSGAPAAGYCETYDLAASDGLARSVIEAQPQIVCADEPTMRIGVKQSIEQEAVYSADVERDAFTRRCTWDPPPEGRFVRARVTSANADAFTGATLYTEATSGL